MKKVLYTSTALVAFAGAAAADVSLSGSAELGIAGGKSQTAQFYQDVDVKFTLSGESDGGLVFGASVDLDEADRTNNFNNIPYSVFVGGEFGTVTMGDTDSAFQFAIDSIDSWGNPGSIADDETAHWGRQGDWLKGSEDGQVLRYDYTYNDFGVAVSLEQDDASDLELLDEDRDRRPYTWAVGATWSPEVGAGVIDLGIGYESAGRGEIGFGLTDLQARDLGEEIVDIFGDDMSTSDIQDAVAESGLFRYNSTTDNYELVVDLGDDVTNVGISAGYAMDNGFSIGGVYTSFDGKQIEKGEYYGIGAGYAFDAFSIHANWGEHTFEAKSGGEIKNSGYGVAAGYDLGGGLSVLAGYGNTTGKFIGDLDDDGDDDRIDIETDTYSLGLKMAF